MILEAPADDENDPSPGKLEKKNNLNSRFVMLVGGKFYGNTYSSYDTAIYVVVFSQIYVQPQERIEKHIPAKIVIIVIIYLHSQL